jgi:hypothetical protein
MRLPDVRRVTNSLTRSADNPVMTPTTVYEYKSVGCAIFRQQVNTVFCQRFNYCVMFQRTSVFSLKPQLFIKMAVTLRLSAGNIHSSSVKDNSHMPCRANAVPMPCPCRAALIHTCHAAPLPFSDSDVSFVKVRVVAGNI